MPFTLPPFDRRMVDVDGFITPEWEPWFTLLGTLPFAAKAHGRIVYSAGVPTLRAGSLNIASIADTGTGVVTINFERPFLSASYVVLLSSLNSVSNNATDAYTIASASQFAITHFESGSTITDPAELSFAVFGELG